MCCQYLPQIFKVVNQLQSDTTYSTVNGRRSRWFSLGKDMRYMSCQTCQDSSVVRRWPTYPIVGGSDTPKLMSLIVSRVTSIMWSQRLKSRDMVKMRGGSMTVLFLTYGNNSLLRPTTPHRTLLISNLQCMLFFAVEARRRNPTLGAF